MGRASANHPAETELSTTQYLPEKKRNPNIDIYYKCIISIKHILRHVIAK